MTTLQQLQGSLLVVKCQLGDRSAWEELHRRYNPALAYYLRRLIPREKVADDVQQEIWLAVVRNIGSLRSPEAFTVWLYRIARGKAIKAIPAGPGQVPLHDAAEPVDEGAEDPPFSADDAAMVHAGLDALGPEHREVLILRFMEDLSYEQIAEVIGCQVGTVRSRIHYGKGALRRLLEQQHA